MGISTNQKRISFFAGYLRLAMNWALVQMPEFDAWERHVTILCQALNATLLHVCGAVSAAPGTACIRERKGWATVRHSYGHLLVITGYKWDYTFYKWGYKYL